MSEGGIPLKTLTVEQLRTVCRNKGLMTGGNKVELQERLTEFASDNQVRRTQDGNDFLIDPRNLVDGDATSSASSTSAPNWTPPPPPPKQGSTSSASSNFTIPTTSQDKLRKQTVDIKVIQTLDPQEIDSLVQQLTDRAEMYGWTDEEALGAAHMKIQHDLKRHLGIYKYKSWKACSAAIKKKYGLSSDYVASLLRNFQKNNDQ